MKVAKLTFDAVSVLHVLIATANNKNLVEVDITRIANFLKLRKSAVRTCVDKLQILEFIEIYSLNVYRICPFLIWRGDIESLEEIIAEQEQERLMLLMQQSVRRLI